VSNYKSKKDVYKAFEVHHYFKRLFQGIDQSLYHQKFIYSHSACKNKSLLFFSLGINNISSTK